MELSLKEPQLTTVCTVVLLWPMFIHQLNNEYSVNKWNEINVKWKNTNWKNYFELICTLFSNLSTECTVVFGIVLQVKKGFFKSTLRAPFVIFVPSSFHGAFICEMCWRRFWIYEINVWKSLKPILNTNNSNLSLDLTSFNAIFMQFCILLKMICCKF